jgi:aspartate kinase
MVIMKFGGTSVQDATAIGRVAEIVRSRREQHPVVVVSAFAKVTDQLVLMGHQATSGDADACLQLLKALRVRHLETARELLGDEGLAKIAGKLKATFDQVEAFLRGLAAIRELSPRSSDQMLSFGELISSEIVAAALAVSGLDTVWVDSRKCVITDARHTRALPLADETRERAQLHLTPLVAKNQIPVMGGFIASTKEGITTTLGRGGSDFSAAIIGAALDAESIEIWTTVT